LRNQLRNQLSLASLYFHVKIFSYDILEMKSLKFRDRV
jgi:hypothetical protein